jgi:SAM-dependent methyltransferase
MTTARIDGTQGYDRDVEAFFERADAIPLADKYAAVLHLLPAAPSRILDIGAGSGKDAADFAALGHTVLAVEPTPVLLAGAIARHAHPSITWLNDGLPDLDAARARGETFDLILLSAVWMHLDEAQRRRAMPNVAALLAEGGVMILSLRHGPVPPGRRMFEVSADETIGLARTEGLSLVLQEERGSIQAANRLAGVTWTILAFKNPVEVDARFVCPMPAAAP